MFGIGEHHHERENEMVLRSVLATLAVVLVFLLVLGTAAYVNRGAIFELLSQNTSGEEGLAAAQNGSTVGNETVASSPTEAVVAEVLPSVVSVVATQEVPVYRRSRAFGRYFYDREGTREREVGGGSGFFVSADGLVVTNKHVVASRESSYSVITSSGEQYQAEVVARDPFIDIAFLRVTNPSGSVFQPLSFSEKEPALGQPVIAIGNALGQFQNTVSSGIISGLSRSIVARGQTGLERLGNVLQTDAAINPGNSGGPLLSLEGKVVGVNVAAAGSGENIAFAIPADFVRSLVASVEERGEIVRPFVGVRYTAVSSLQQPSELSVERGVLVRAGEGVSAVVPHSPAAKAGIEEGDIILSVDGEAIDAENSFGYLIRKHAVGETIMLTVVRDGERMEISLTLEEAPEELGP